jgi:hypothetical protein
VLLELEFQCCLPDDADADMGTRGPTGRNVDEGLKSHFTTCPTVI